MKHGIASAVLPLFVSVASYAQAPERLLEFEVASVKLAPPRKVGEPRGRVGCSGGPGSKDPIRFTCSNASVSLLAIEAYGVKPYAIRPPVSTDTGRFNIEAKVPPGANPERVKLMLQTLLTERFKLAFHREKAETQGYALVVAKNGLKMRKSLPPPADANSPPPAPIKDPDGFEYIPMRNAMRVGRANGLTRWVGNNITVEWLAGLLNSLTGRPITDATGLQGNYDFTLTFSSEVVGEAPSPPPVPDSSAELNEYSGLTVFAALERQLGLKLEPRKMELDLFVIDHAEKTSVGN